MKQVAVVGLKNVDEFKSFMKDFIPEADRQLCQCMAYDINTNTKYVFIGNKEDIKDKKFNSILECDQTRLELRLHLIGEGKGGTK